MLRRATFILSAGLIASAVAPVRGVWAANPACDWYVTQSIRQQQENTQRACGLRSGEWSPEARVHARYCEGHTPQEAREMIATRQRQLAECAEAAAKLKR